MITRTDTVYICEHCGAAYRSSADAAVCEDNHKTALTISRAIYEPIEEISEGFPRRLYVMDTESEKSVIYSLMLKKGQRMNYVE